MGRRRARPITTADPKNKNALPTSWCNTAEIWYLPCYNQQNIQTTTTADNKTTTTTTTTTYDLHDGDIVRLSLSLGSNNPTTSDNNNRRMNQIRSSIIQVSSVTTTTNNNSSISNNTNNNNNYNDKNDSEYNPIITSPRTIVRIHPILYEILNQLYYYYHNYNASHNALQKINGSTTTQQQPVPKNNGAEQQPTTNDTNFDCTTTDCIIQPLPIGSYYTDNNFHFLCSGSIRQQQQQQQQQQQYHNGPPLRGTILNVLQDDSNNNRNNQTAATAIPELQFDSIIRYYVLYNEGNDDNLDNNNDDDYYYCNNTYDDDDTYQIQAAALAIPTDDDRSTTTTIDNNKVIEVSFRDRIVTDNSIVLLSCTIGYTVIVIEKIVINDNNTESKPAINSSCYIIKDPTKYKFERLFIPNKKPSKTTALPVLESDTNTTDSNTSITAAAAATTTISKQRTSKQQQSTKSGYDEQLNEITNLLCLYFFGTKNTQQQQQQDYVTAAPTAILITGCAGVGKTTLVSNAIDKFVSSYKSKSAVSSTIRNYIVSTNDLLLQASWSTEVMLLQKIRPPSLQKSSSSTTTKYIVVLDDLDAISLQDGDDRLLDTEKQLVCNAIIRFIDETTNPSSSTTTTPTTTSSSSSPSGLHSSPCIMIIGIVRNSKSLPPDLVKFGRFEKEYIIHPPTQYQRECILQQLLSGLSIISSSSSSVNNNESNTNVENNESKIQKWSEAIASITPGCVAGDLHRLCTTAYSRAVTRSYYQNDDEDDEYHYDDNIAIDKIQRDILIQLPAQVEIRWDDLVEAATNCTPSQLVDLDVIKPAVTTQVSNDDEKQNWSSVHNESWKHFAGYDNIKKRLYRTVVVPWKRLLLSETTKNGDSIIDHTMMIQPPSGVLFHGVSGCGKTVAALCLGASLGLPMIKVGAADILNKWLGGSEAIIRSLFVRARAAAPCILFFDEIDAIACNRSLSDDSDGGGGGDVMSRLLSTLLNEMDGITNAGSNPTSGTFSSVRGRVLVIACTNRIEALDAALLRAGRLEEHILLTPPSIEDAMTIFEYYFRKVPLHKDVNLHPIASELVEQNEITGAEIEGICREAVFGALRRVNDEDEDDTVGMEALSVHPNDLTEAINALGV